MFSRIWTKKSTPDYSAQIKDLQTALSEADTVVIGAGAGLSTSAGFIYTGERSGKRGVLLHFHGGVSFSQ